MNPQYYEDKTLTNCDAFNKLRDFKEKNPTATVNMNFEAVISFWHRQPLERFLDSAKGKIGITSVSYEKTNRIFLVKFKINLCGEARAVYSVITDIASMYPNSDYDN